MRRRSRAWRWQTPRLAAAMVRLEVLAADDPPRFIHPVVRDALEASLAGDERDSAHRLAARLLHADGALPGRVAAHLVGLRSAGDRWVLARLEEAARAAMASGAPQAAARLLSRALAEPPPLPQRVGVLREAARAEASAGRETACLRLEEALQLVTDPRRRAEIALEVAEAYAALFRWVDAVDVLEPALAELGAADAALVERLEGELVVSGLHDARRASRVAPVLSRLAARQPETPGKALAVAQGMAAFMAGRPADEIAVPLEATLARAGAHATGSCTAPTATWVPLNVPSSTATSSMMCSPWNLDVCVGEGAEPAAVQLDAGVPSRAAHPARRPADDVVRKHFCEPVEVMGVERLGALASDPPAAQSPWTTSRCSASATASTSPST